MDKQNIIVPRIKISTLKVGSSMDVYSMRRDSSLWEESFVKRRMDSRLLKEFIQKDKEWRQIVVQLDEFRSKRNKISHQISREQGNQSLVEQARELNKNMEDLESKIKDVVSDRDKLLLSIPNLVDPLQPIDNATTIAVLGTPHVDEAKVENFRKENPDINFKKVQLTMNQYDIIKKYKLVNEERGAELSGSRFYYKTNELSILDMSLSLYAMKILYNDGFQAITPPYLVKRYVEERATTLDAFEETLYKVEGEDLFLIPTAEHPIAAFNAGVVFNKEQLPLRYAGFSTSFRKEAGSHGKDTKGIYRNHHFNKVEQYVITDPEKMEDELNTLINNQVKFLLSLNIPVRIIKLPAWDMDKKAIFHVDIEGWFSGQNRFGELGSHAIVGTWQATRLNIKYLPSEKEDAQYVCTIYGTMLPVERTLACMLENNLGEDGTITVPKPLADISGINEIKKSAD